MTDYGPGSDCQKPYFEMANLCKKATTDVKFILIDGQQMLSLVTGISSHNYTIISHRASHDENKAGAWMDHNLTFGTKIRVLHLKTEIYHSISE